MSNYYISDLHFGHKNCLAYDNRKFKDIETHDQFIMDKWNQTVNIDDDVYILGDVSWHNVTKTIDILNNLNGNKHLIIGNHDKKFLRNKDFRDQFVEVADYKEIVLDDREKNGIVLCHYPIPCFNHHYYGWYHLYGHVHNSFEWGMMEHDKYLMSELYNVPCRMYNVGAMLWYMNYTPKTLDQIAISSTIQDEIEF